jgi:EAL and modified HD-GYP domain-containing signal transduction protein
MTPRVEERLFGRRVDGGLASPGAAGAFPTQPAIAQHAGAFVERDEILDARSRISGYRFRTVSADGAVRPPLAAKVEALIRDNLAGFAQRRMATVSLTADEWLQADFRQFVTPNTIFEIDVPRPDSEVAPWLALVRDIKSRGARIGFDGIVASSRLSEALPLADAIFVRTSDYTADGLAGTMRHLRSLDPAYAIIVDGVNDWPEFRACLEMGANYCMGSFTSVADEGSRS